MLDKEQTGRSCFELTAVVKIPCLQSLCSTSKGCDTETANALGLFSDTMEPDVQEWGQVINVTVPEAVSETRPCET